MEERTMTKDMYADFLAKAQAAFADENWEEVARLVEEIYGAQPPRPTLWTANMLRYSDSTHEWYCSVSIQRRDMASIKVSDAIPERVCQTANQIEQLFALPLMT